MKLCQIVPSLEEQYGGPSRSVYALAAALARGGDEVELFATQPEPAAEARDEGALRVRVFRRDWPQRFCPSAGLRDAVARSDAAIIHHHSLWLRTVHYAHTRAKESRAKFVVSPRGMMSAWAWRHRRWRKQFARTLIHPGALEAVDGWHATSPEEADDIRTLGFAQPVCVAPNAVERPSESTLLSAAAHWNKVCPEVAKRPVALFYSRFHQKKRVIELIDLWLERAPRDWLLLLVGIPQNYAPADLEAYVTRMSGAGRVRAFSGIGQPAPYAVASLFVLPSHNENFGLVIAEALAHGVPALVTDTTPWQGLNTDDRGWCVAWANYGDALVAATAEDAERLRERGRRAREWVLGEFSWEKSAHQLAAFYRELLRSP
jgi:glycosyltransferase involved in cell wall biosynthesis